tara:strand:+ start:104 stop:544 length:441 start_codon:yes stop_codon:yes gene_type:complete
MIIDCPCGEKKFEIDQNLIPEEGRLLQCGFCNKKWFFNIKKKEVSETKVNVKNKKLANSDNNDLNLEESEINLDVNTDNVIKVKNYFSFSIFLSYILVSIISFVALIILIDTFKSPIYRIFPNLELILFNLFETLRDIKLFIKDLF